MTAWLDYINDLNTDVFDDTPTYSSLNIGTGLVLNGNIRQSRGTIASSNFATTSTGYSLDAADGSIEVQHVISNGGLHGATITGGEMSIGDHFFVAASSSSGTDVVFGVGEHTGIKTQSTSGDYSLAGVAVTTAASGSGGGPFQVNKNGALTTTGITMDSVSLTTIQTASESFADNDTSLMTSAAIDDRINASTPSAAGSDHHVQFNDDGSFGGTANLTFDGTNLSAGKMIYASGGLAMGLTTSSSFTIPWSVSTINLGNYGSVGSQGSYRTSLAWNWERGVDTGSGSPFVHLDVNSYPQAGSIEIGNSGILFEYDDDYETTHTTHPVIRARITSAGLILGSGTTGPILSEGDANSLRIETGDGYMDIGAQNAGADHVYASAATLFLGQNDLPQYGFTSSAMYSYQYELTNRSIGTGSDPFYDINYSGWIRIRTNSRGIYWQGNAAGLQGTSGGIMMYGTNKVFYLKSGSAGAPGLSVINDTDTGLYFTTNVIRFTTGGVQRGLFSSSGLYAIKATGWGTTAVWSSSTGYLLKYSSSIRYKENVADMPKSEWEKIYQLVPRSFDWKEDGSCEIPVTGKDDFGFIAEEVNSIIPKVVTYARESNKDDDDELGLGNESELQIEAVSYEKLTPYLVAAVKDLKARIETLEG